MSVYSHKNRFKTLKYHTIVLSKILGINIELMKDNTSGKKGHKDLIKPTSSDEIHIKTKHL